ncbi:MAG: hypothetical protein COA92_04400 [Sulfurovum sp.]|nr:MAG: hypothetical protein COA92_04400 [Sulfurovum sp.]
MIRLIVVIVLVLTLSQGSLKKANSKVEEVIKSSFPNVTEVEPKQLILTKSLFTKVQFSAKASMRTKIYRYYRIKSAKKIIGYAVLTSRILRTKKAVVLYAFDMKGNLKFTEIMAFGEPPEFSPNSQWMTLLQNKRNNTRLTLGKDIPTISGSTLSARTITEGARVARAIYNEILKNKQ